MNSLEEIFDYRNKEIFEKMFIYEGMNAFQMSQYFEVDNSVIYDWRDRHGLPNHKDKDKIIEIYGEAVYNNIVAMKSQRYKDGKGGDWAKKRTGKTLEEIHGEEKGKALRQSRVGLNKGVVRSQQFKDNLRSMRKGNSNPNWKGGFYSSQHKQIDRSLVWQYSAGIFNNVAVIEQGFICKHCNNDNAREGHHVLSFSTIFGEICDYALRNNCLNTQWVVREIYNFHKLYWAKIYKCLCVECHKDIHKSAGNDRRNMEQLELIYLLNKYTDIIEEE